ncbi:MAG: YebC/PmpR family DNA-binding transcriptional regulator [Acidiferrobacterales bacterium]|nr:YebC/PmpR family DNA-binding transcriptional regulator [Acidiferrobacterales bacterium]
MAGHSKWANIRFRKAAQDSRRGKLFSKLIREITVATRTGNPDPDSNPRLRSAIDKALAANMGRDVINRAVQRGSGESGGDGYQDVIYEGYGPGGVAMLIECSTDNRNRTVSEVRHALTKHGGNLGTEGSVSYLFNRVGLIQFLSDSDEEQIMDVAISAGADDIDVLDDGSIMVSTPVEFFIDVVKALDEADISYEEAGIEQRASASQEIGEEMVDRVLNLINAIEDLDDVQDVYTNAEFFSQAEL